MKNAKPRKKLLFYVLLGVAYVALLALNDGVTAPKTFLPKLFNHCWLTGYLVINNYLFFEYTLRFFVRSWKKLLVLPVLLFAHMLFYSLGTYGWRAIGINLHIFTEFITHRSIEEGTTYYLPYVISSIVFFALVKLAYDHMRLRQTTQQLTIEKQQAELSFLKSQTNPHFLFNTLNNIYSLAKDKSDLAPESILRLAKILRFMLYETSGKFIAIEQELTIIGDYIALEQLRYDATLLVNFNYDVEELKQSIPPLLLMPLVENAFKHGVSETREHPHINIHLSVKGQQLVYIVKNSANGGGEGAAIKENIGLSNLRRQLELIFTDFNLVTRREADIFTATLQINLASHV